LSERRNELRHTGESRYSGPPAPAALAPDRASHYFPGTKRSSMQRLTGQNRIGAGAISRIPAASARALLGLKRLVLRRP